MIVCGWYPFNLCTMIGEMIRISLVIIIKCSLQRINNKCPICHIWTTNLKDDNSRLVICFYFGDLLLKSLILKGNSKTDLDSLISSFPMYTVLIHLCPRKTRPFTESLSVCNFGNKQAHMQGNTFTNKETSVRTETMETRYCEEDDWDIAVPRACENMSTKLDESDVIMRPPFETVG